jgi:hypothetical protein
MTIPSYWKTVCTHEAGHAVAALALFDVAADIYVKPTDDPAAPYSASYRNPIIIVPGKLAAGLMRLRRPSASRLNSTFRADRQRP